MKWKSKGAFIGDTRIVTKFLLLPKTIGCQTRWLERASWEQVWNCDVLGTYWKDSKWSDNKQSSPNQRD